MFFRTIWWLLILFLLFEIEFLSDIIKFVDISILLQFAACGHESFSSKPFFEK